MAEVSIHIQKVTIRHRQQCMACQGAGLTPDSKGNPAPCPWCAGQGRVDRPERVKRQRFLLDGRPWL